MSWWRRLALVLMAIWVPASAAEDTMAKNTTVLITGANRGIGLEFAKQYAAEGFDVIGTARAPEKATALKETGAEVLKLDVTKDEEIRSAQGGSERPSH